MTWVKHYPNNPKDIILKNSKRPLGVIDIYKKEKFPEFKAAYPSKNLI
jgi:hypothetical protein